MEWTEDEVRKLTGWKAFRDGKSLADRGSVSDFKQRGELLTGVFKMGRRKLRTVVRSAEPLSVECGCEDNRRSGGVCAHGVALLLKSIQGEAMAEAALPHEHKDELVGELIACRVLLPERFSEMLGKGKLWARIEQVEAEPDQVDAGMSLWIARNAPGPDFPKMISLGAGELSQFLDLLVGHQRLRIEGREAELVLRSERLPPLRLGNSELRGERIYLKLAEFEGREVQPIMWGESLALVVDDGEGVTIGKLPAESPSRCWSDEAADLLREGWLEISRNELLRDLDAWLDLFESPAPGWLGQLHFEAGVPEFHLELEGSLTALDAKASFRYPGGRSCPLGADWEQIEGLPGFDEQGILRTRSVATEKGGLMRLLAQGFVADPRGGEFQLRDSEQILAFVADGLPALQRDWQVRLGSRFEHVLKSVHVVRPQIEASENQSLAYELFFETDAGKAIPGSKVREILRAGRRSVKTKSGAQVVISSAIPELVEPLMADLGIVSTEGKIHLDRAKSLLFSELRKKLDNSQSISDEPACKVVPVPAGLQAQLRDYQEAGFCWLVDRLGSLSGALLADEMGLGKTVQTIALIEHFKQCGESGPSLVLVPTSLLGNWQEEFRRFAPKLQIVTLHGSGRDLLREQVSAADCVLTSYGTLARDLAFHLRQSYALLVADEASLLRNPDSEISRSVAKLQASKRLALTGTPVENRILDLWSIFRVVAPGYLGAKSEFLERYESAESAGATERLRLRVSPYLLRRTKSEVAKDLPEKVVVDEWLDLDPEARKRYSEVAQAGLQALEEIQKTQGVGAGSLHLLTVLLRLRQICLEPSLIEKDDSREPQGIKSKRLFEILTEREEQGKKTLVFSQFREYLRILKKCDDLPGGQRFLLDGSTRNRARLVSDFQSTEGPAVFLISLKAGGYGLNLTAADTVIHMDPWWNPAVEAQASDRAHRIGQTEPVTVYRLLTRATVEERVKRMQASKQAVIDALASDEIVVPSNWSESDLRGIVEG